LNTSALYRYLLILNNHSKNIWLCILLFLLLPFFSLSQTPETQNTEQQIENITENNEDAETEDDTYLQQMQQYVKHPVNINTALQEDLQVLRILSPQQIQNLLGYRKAFGNFINVYELQAVPGFTVNVLQKIKPYITTTISQNITESISTRLSGGEHSILARLTQTLQKSKGYLRDSVTNFYPGSPQKVLVRYKYQFKNLLQYGVVAEKDAGEQFFTGAQKQGFDFYSAHFFLRNSGSIKSLALGDFTVNLGQGLTQWQSLAFKKSVDVTNIKREAETLRPYNAAGEVFFHRGAGITVKKKNLQATAFASYKNIDANFVADTLSTTDDFVSSLQTSGLHRTKSETTDKGIQQQLVVGGNVGYKSYNLQLGINAVQYQFKLPLKKDSQLYNLYAPAGKRFGNYSADYSYTYKNLHFFGEAALNNTRHTAFVNGLLLSTSSIVDMSFLYRNIQPGYQSFYSNAFTESTVPTNEKGFYMGMSVHPQGAWQINAYADFYKFPWLRFRTDAPSDGADYLLQLTYKPNKQFEMYSRFRFENKGVNFTASSQTLTPVQAQRRKNWRTHFSYKINPALTLRSRAEVVWFSANQQTEHGFLMYADFFYKPLLKPWGVNARAQFFETESYNTRLYAYEADVLYSFSIPVFYNKGVRFFVNASYDVTKKATIWFRVAQTAFKNQNSIGGGLDEIKGSNKTECKLQLQLYF
jgi:hypothetical protein